MQRQPIVNALLISIKVLEQYDTMSEAQEHQNPIDDEHALADQDDRDGHAPTD